MASHSKAEVQAALTHLMTGNGGNPLTREQMAWELNPINGTGFGECLVLAAKHPDLFPSVLTAPYFRRQPIGVPNVICEDGRRYVLASGGFVTPYEASGAPIGVGFPSYSFSNATLSD
jgi:hypothetical protein